MSEHEKLPADIVREVIDEQLKRIRLALDDRNLSKVAAGSGLHENTVRYIASGKGETPTLATLEKLGNYLFK
jgi:hypothetical protein